MKTIIGYNEIKIEGTNGRAPAHGYTIFYKDSDQDVTEGEWCGSQYVSADKIAGFPAVGSVFEFTFKASKDSQGKTCFRVSGMVIG